MQGHRFALSANLHGTLAANASGQFILPCAAVFEGVSISNSAASDAILDVGTSADDDGIFADIAIGDSSVPVFYDKDDFNGALATAGQPYYLAAGTIFKWALDFDGAAGVAAANAALAFYFFEA